MAENATPGKRRFLIYPPNTPQPRWEHPRKKIKLKIKLRPLPQPKEKPPRTCQICEQDKPVWQFPSHGSGLVCGECEYFETRGRGCVTTMGRWDAPRGGAWDSTHMNEILTACRALEKTYG